MKQPVQMQPRIQGKRVRCDDRPVSAPNVHSFSGSRFAALSEHVTNVESLVIDLDQLGRAVQAKLEFPPTELLSRQMGDDGSRSDDQSALNLIRAKSLASASVANVLVKRGCRRLNSVPSGGTSKVTYHVCFMPPCRSAWVACPLYRDNKAAGNGTIFLARDCKQVLYRRAPTRLTPPFALPPAL